MSMRFLDTESGDFLGVESVGFLDIASAVSWLPAFGPGLGSVRVKPWWLALFHSFHEVDVDLPAWWPVGQGDW